MIPSISIIVLSLLGFLLSAYIWRTKIGNKKLICFIGESCDTVVRGRFSETFGIPNEILGVVYYGTIAAAYGIPHFFLAAPSHVFDTLLFILTGLAALFALYLVFLQLSVLKDWCVWCLASSLISIVIFLLVFST